MDIIDETDRCLKHIVLMDRLADRGRPDHILHRDFTAKEIAKIRSWTEAGRKALSDGDPMTYREFLHTVNQNENLHTHQRCL